MPRSDIHPRCDDHARSAMAPVTPAERDVVALANGFGCRSASTLERSFTYRYCRGGATVVGAVGPVDIHPQTGLATLCLSFYTVSGSYGLPTLRHPCQRRHLSRHRAAIVVPQGILFAGNGQRIGNVHTGSSEPLCANGCLCSQINYVRFYAGYDGDVPAGPSAVGHGPGIVRIRLPHAGAGGAVLCQSADTRDRHRLPSITLHKATSDPDLNCHCNNMFGTRPVRFAARFSGCSFFAISSLCVTQEWIAIVCGRHKGFLNRPRRHPPEQVHARPGLIVRT